MPIILIIGHQGQVGWELQRLMAPLGRVIAVDYPELDLADSSSIKKWIHDTSPTVIINAAAYTDVDKAESEPERCYQINATAPAYIAQLGVRPRNVT